MYINGNFILQKMIYRSDLSQNPDKIYVFGDNMIAQGYGGQAKEMRGMINSLGIPTKWSPSNNESAFFRDKDFDKVGHLINFLFTKLEEHIIIGRDVVYPLDGIGTGLSRLPETAPRIDLLIKHHENELKRKYSVAID